MTCNIFLLCDFLIQSNTWFFSSFTFEKHVTLKFHGKMVKENRSDVMWEKTLRKGVTRLSF